MRRDRFSVTFSCQSDEMGRFGLFAQRMTMPAQLQAELR
jgi:hypothetical protein